jgi:hypothetical protein
LSLGAAVARNLARHVAILLKKLRIKSGVKERLNCARFHDESPEELARSAKVTRHPVCYLPKPYAGSDQYPPSGSLTVMQRSNHANSATTQSNSSHTLWYPLWCPNLVGRFSTLAVNWEALHLCVRRSLFQVRWSFSHPIPSVQSLLSLCGRLPSAIRFTAAR